jgi:hypothetical protein
MELDKHYENQIDALMFANDWSCRSGVRAGKYCTVHEIISEPDLCSSFEYAMFGENRFIAF